MTECFGTFTVKEAYSADETTVAQRKAEVTMAFNVLGVLKNDGGCAAVQEEGLEVRDVRRAIAQTLKAKGADTGVGAGPATAGEVSGETFARIAVCTAEVTERLRIMARTSVVAARMLANEERNRQLSRGGAAP